MFEKLLSVLPYNPGLAHQLSFYSRRMREEAAIRRIGVVFLVLAFMVQFMAVLSPPQPTSASSNNDLINGGVSSIADAARNCRNNVQHYGNIMNFYGISCSDIAAANSVSLNSASFSNQLYSMGRLSYGTRNANTGKLTNETPVNITGAGTLYVRHLSSFDGGSSSTYRALKFKSSTTGKTFYILYSCGNLVSVGIPSGVTKVVTKEPGGAAITLPTPKPTPKPTPTPTPKPVPTPTPTPTPTPKCIYNSSLPANSPLCFQPCQYNNAIASSSPDCKPCDKSVSSQDSLACIAVSKAASNITAGLSDADNTTANPGDIIVYTLYAKNNGKAAVKDFTFQENLSDVMDYADTVDLHGGSLSTDLVVSWPAETIAAASTASHQITVKVKSPVPQTPTGSSDPAHFDLVMTNVYGNAVNIKLPGSPAKTVETVTTSTLPNTGPGTSLIVAASIVVFGGYFYGRARLLAEESNLAVQESIAA